MDSVPAPAEKEQLPSFEAICNEYEYCGDCPLDENCPWEDEDE